MKQQLEAIRKAALDAISDAGKAEDLEALRVRYLGKKGELTAVLKQMGKLSAEERPVIGQLANDVRAKLEANIEEKTKELADKAMELKLKSEAVDVTIPGKQEKIGVKHPMYQVLDEIKDIFVGMGFEILEDREVELAEYNFTKLNVEEGHPAREWSDTFYFNEDSSILLRTQTSPMQIRAMEEHGVPIRMISPGRVYRNETTDARHELKRMREIMNQARSEGKLFRWWGAPDTENYKRFILQEGIDLIGADDLNSLFNILTDKRESLGK
jgi:phenylalanyl-tRNA synthetase alpha chain